MIDINEIKAGRISEFEKLNLEILDIDLSGLTLYHIKNSTMHSSAIVGMKNGLIVFKLFKTTLLVEREYVTKLNRFDITIGDFNKINDNKNVGEFGIRVTKLVNNLPDVREFIILENIFHTKPSDKTIHDLIEYVPNLLKDD